MIQYTQVRRLKVAAVVCGTAGAVRCRGRVLCCVLFPPAPLVTISPPLQTNRIPPELKESMQEHLRLHFDTQDASDEQARRWLGCGECRTASVGFVSQDKIKTQTQDQLWSRNRPWSPWSRLGKNDLCALPCPVPPQVLSIYPTPIRRRILAFLYMRHLSSCYLFRKCPQRFLDALLASARVEVFMPGGCEP